MKLLSFITIAFVAVATSIIPITSARADTYSWQNLQSDIAGVAQHVDANLINPWGMAPNSAGTVIWVSNNGTGTSTLYAQNGTANPLIVTVPGEDRRNSGNPTG